MPHPQPKPLSSQTVEDLLGREFLRMFCLGFSQAFDVPVTLLVRNEETDDASLEKRFDRIPADKEQKKWCPFCNTCRASDEGNRLCLLDDAQVATDWIQGRTLPDPPYYLCHAGLCDISVPVTVLGKVVGVFFTGQRRPDESLPHLQKQAVERRDEIIKQLGLGQQELVDSWEAVEEAGDEALREIHRRLAEIADRLGSVAEEVYRQRFAAEKENVLSTLLQELQPDAAGPWQEVDSEKLLSTAAQAVRDFAGLDWFVAISEDPETRSHVSAGEIEPESRQDYYEQIFRLVKNAKELRRKWNEGKIVYYAAIDGHQHRETILTDLLKTCLNTDAKHEYIVFRHLRSTSYVNTVVIGAAMKARDADVWSNEGAEHLTENVAAITDQIRILLDIAESARLQQAFIRDTAHSLRSPVNWVMAAAAGLQWAVEHMQVEGPSALQQITDAGEELVDAADAMRVRVETYQFIGLADVAQRVYSFKMVDLIELVQNLKRWYEYEASDHNKVIAVKADVGLLMAEIDVGHFQIALANVLHNAVKYSHSNKTIDINIYAPGRGDFVRIVLQDYGLGIHPDELELVKRRYYRAREWHDEKRTIPGSGIGLAVADEIVRAHQGTLEIASSRPSQKHTSTPGEGYVTTVVISIPKQQPR